MYAIGSWDDYIDSMQVQLGSFNVDLWALHFMENLSSKAIVGRS